MINLEPVLSRPLWAAIERSYQSGQFTAAILDAIHYLGELIREKSGIEGDGAQLIGQAFGGDNPPIKVNKLQTESERNVQKGLEQILRGLYQAVRNPRSHEKYNDSSDDAEGILLFVNYLIKIISQSTSQFEMTDYLERVFDPFFTDEVRYVELLVDEIPIGKRWDVLMEVYRRKEEGEKKIRLFVETLLDKMEEAEISEFCKVVSGELSTTRSIPTMRAVLRTVPEKYWLKYSEVARLRVEARLIEDIRDGRYMSSQRKLLSGAFGTWAVGYLREFILRDRLAAVLLAKLRSSDRTQQDYVFEYFAF